MAIHDELGNRMKSNYEEVSKTRLFRRIPVAIRIDGKAFHTFTKGFRQPFDDILSNSMSQTMKYLCENIQGCVLGYKQSDEITLILIDYQKLNSDAWFNYEIQKLCSISASMATMEFNRVFRKEVEYFMTTHPELLKEDDPYIGALASAVRKGAMFDSRCFNIPKEEVTNLLYWRQLDATRNSIEMVGRTYFSHKELMHKSCNMIQDMLHEQKGINWNDYPVKYKRGLCCIKEDYFEPREDGEEIRIPEGCSDPMNDPDIEKGVWRSRWIIDENIPIWKGDDRAYIDNLINVGDF